MAHKEREQSNIIVNQIDLTSIIDTFTFVEVDVIYSYGYIETNKGILAVCSEGLGWTLYNEGDSCHIDIFAKEGEHDLPLHRFIVSLTSDKIKKLPIIDKVPLEKFVRTFGARLDTNYEILKQTVEEANKVT